MSILVSQETSYRFMDDDSETWDRTESMDDLADIKFSFKELVQKITSEGFFECSCFPPKGHSMEWLSTPYKIIDCKTGELQVKSLHYSHKNQPRAAKYWRKAFIAAGIIKGVSK